MDSMEMIVFNMISNAGDASSKFLEAVKKAENENFKEAEELIEVGSESLLKAHAVQTKLIHQEGSGENKHEIGILMIHAQDHLMNAMLLKDMAKSMINLHKKIADK